MFWFTHPPTDTSMLFSLRTSRTMHVFYSPHIYFLSTDAGVVGLGLGFCALPGLILPQALRKPVSKAIRQSDIRQSDIRQSDIRQPDIRQTDIRHPTIRHPTKRAYTKKLRWHVPTECRDVGKRAHGKSNLNSRKRALAIN